MEQCFEGDIGRYLSYYVPLLHFHENWIALEEGSFSLNADTTDLSQTMGYWYTDAITPVEAVDPSTFTQEELSDMATEVLDEIVKICTERDIEILFYTVPYAGGYQYSQAMERYAEENQCVYIDLFDHLEEMDFDCNTDMADASHVNYDGALKVTNFLGAYMDVHYDLPDVRLVEGNSWDMALASVEEG